MDITTVEKFLVSKGRQYPQANAEGLISEAQFVEAGLPMVVACAHCTMTMGLHAELPIDAQSGKIFCGDCAEAFES